MTSSLIPLSSSMLSGTTSTSPIPPSSHVRETVIEPVRQTGSHQSSTEQTCLTPTTPPFTEMSPYKSLSYLQLHQGQHETPCPSLSLELPRQHEQRSPSLGGGESHQGVPLMSRVSINTTAIEEEQRQSRQRSSEGSMNISPVSGLVPEERPYTTLPAVAGQRYSPLKSMSTELPGGEAPLPPQSLHRQSRTLPQPTTPITIAQALYLLATGKLVQIPDILLRVPLDELFNHFKEELVADQDWTRTPAGMNYAHYGYSYILNEEALHFACHAHNMIHPNQPIQIPECYRRPKVVYPPITDTPEPMEDEPLVPLQRAFVPDYTYAIPSYAYVAPNYMYP